MSAWLLPVDRHSFLQTVQHILYICVTLLFSEGVMAQQRFIIEPQDTSAIEGSTAILKCKVANMVGGLQWTRDSFALGMDRNLPGFPRYQMIGGQTQVGSETIGEHNLKITEVNLEDDAEYQCQVGATESVQGIRSHTAKLNVLLPPDRPRIENGMRVAVVVGRLANITCRANNGKPSATITWHMDGQRLTEMIYSRSIPKVNDKRVDSVGIITVNATKEDEGRRIECKAENEAMVLPFSTFATLDVQYPPYITMMTNLSRTIREYDYIRIFCRVEAANPRGITWRWLRNGRILHGETRDVLDIPSISRAYHQNTITCEGSNQVGSTRKNKELNVEFGPLFVGDPQHTAVNLNQPATLRCDATGNPPPSIIWTKKGSRHPQGSSPELRIPKVGEGNLGVYVCTANVLGFNSISREIYLLQNAPPTIMSEVKQYAVTGENAEVECMAMSVPKPDKIIWMRDGIPINYATSGRFSAMEEDLPYGRKSTLQIINVNEEDFGDYNCSVINNYGKDVAVIHLIEKAVPPLPIIIGGAVGGVAVLFIIILACVLYHRYKSAETGSVLGSYTDTDSSTDKKREKSDSPSTLMDQWRQDYNKDLNRYSADYDEVLYAGKDPKGNNNQYRVIDPFSNENVYRDTSQIFGGEYTSQSDDIGSDRYGPAYSGQYPLSSFRGDYADSRLPPACLSTTKLATNV
ncbi:kin of IRRE-like protein 1 isoform X1 [Haliotis asinina]|uniref:kin of IRRE-like protein 1 isoform X1 n=1 Tax=Haliotis asinina TaxID=109174 RepID=UPI003532696B